MTRLTLRSLSLALVLVTIAFSGCFGAEEAHDDAHDGHEEDAGHEAGEEGGNETESPPVPASDPPRVELNVSGENVTILSDENGTRYEVKLGSTVSVNATVTDGSGGNLSYIWSMGDNSTSNATGASVEYMYAAVGNYTVSLTVTSDASGLSGEGSAAIVVVAGMAAPKQLTFTGKQTGGYVEGYTHPAKEHKFPVELYTKIHARISWGDTSIDMDYGLYTPDGEEAARAANYNDPAGVTGDPEEEDLIIEDAEILAKTGEWTLKVWAGTAYDADYTVVIDFS